VLKAYISSKLPPPNGPGNAHGCAGALDLDRVDDDAHVREAVPDRLLQVVDDGARGGGDEGDGRGKEGQLAFALGVERALELQATLQLFEARAQLADVVELDLVDDEAEAADLAEEIDLAAEDEDLAVLGQGRDPPRVVGEKDGVDTVVAVLDGEVVVAGCATLHAADLALDEERGQRAELAADLVGELCDRVGPLRFVGSEHAV
jgi:hypothetical protein